MWVGEANSRIADGMWQHIDHALTGLSLLNTGSLFEGDRKQRSKYSCNTGIILNSQFIICMKLSTMVRAV